MDDTFEWEADRLAYLDHPYNSTRSNERCVEVPIALRWLFGWPDPAAAVAARWTGWQARSKGQVLEVGNVLSHYIGRVRHRVVDRHEVGPQVENLDVFDVRAPYDRIVAISTLEHVRWDERPRNESGAFAALEHLRSLLVPGGVMLVTIPTGCHPDLDRRIAAGETGASRCMTYVRSEADVNTWQVDGGDVVRPYGVRTLWAEAVWVAEFGPLAAPRGMM